MAVFCAHQYMPWNLLLIKVLINFWYFKHQISTGTCSEAYLSSAIVRFCFFQRQLLQLCFKYASEQIIVKIGCSKYQTLFKTLIRNIFQGMYCRAHKTATLTPIQHTVPLGVLEPPWGWWTLRRSPRAFLAAAATIFVSATFFTITSAIWPSGPPGRL